MIKQIQIISVICFFNLLIFSSLALGEGMGNHSKEMMMDQMTGMLTGAKGHQAEGKVTIIHKEKGETVLRITGATIDKVPDGRIYLAKNGDYTQGVELGKLNKFSGDLEFKIPADVDTGAYNSVVVWCKRFNVEIGHAFFDQKIMK